MKITGEALLNLKQWFSTSFGPGTTFWKIYPMDHFAMHLMNN